MGYTIWPDSPMGEVLQDVYKERLRQEELKRQGKFAYTCADAGITHHENLGIIAEEIGEVARILNEALGAHRFEITKMREELVQVAAVAVAWVEKVDHDIAQYKRASAELTK